jgi:hypothetical protein
MKEKMGRNPFQARRKSAGKSEQVARPQAAGGGKRARGPRLKGLVLRAISWKVEGFTLCRLGREGGVRKFSLFATELRNRHAPWNTSFELRVLRSRPLILSLFSLRLQGA